MAPPDGAGGAPAATARLHDRYDIHFETPAPELRLPNAPAYTVDDTKSLGTQSFALVPDPKLPTRTHLIGDIRKLQNIGLLTPLDIGVVDWPKEARRCLVMIYERPAGGRLVTSLDQTIPSIGEDDILRRFFVPIITTLKDMFGENLTHRGIRPTNLLFRDAGQRTILLGDCLAAAPGANQPFAWETIEGATCGIQGRGEGMPSDDLYALGVTILFLYFGSNPAAGLSDAQILDRKLTRGSFATLVGERRLPTTLGELCRGLLTDDPRERWTTGDIELWMTGRGFMLKQQSNAKRSTRPFEVSGESFYTAKTLAHGLARQGDRAITAVTGRLLQVWLERSLADKERLAAVEVAGAHSEDSARNAVQDARTIARVVMALDPDGPIRYRGAATMVSGIGPSLAAVLMEGSDIKPFAEMLLGRLPQFWIAVQIDQRPENASLAKRFDGLRRLLEDTRPGFGIERLVYELNPTLRCLSPMVDSHHVVEMYELLPALERAVVAGEAKGLPVDRHIAAFLGHRFKGSEDAALIKLAQSDGAGRVLALLQILARLQGERGPESLPALAALFSKQVAPAVDQYRNRKTRAEISARLGRVSKNGNLVELLNSVDNQAERTNDATMFKRARIQFSRSRKYLAALDTDDSNVQSDGIEAGASVAVGLSSVLACATVIIALFVLGGF
ncbi:MAG TPA: hypothetical protein VNT30_15180 [Stellaceae bacterium]|nr:hypothetical protein [Stellaceae bacterium]